MKKSMRRTSLMLLVVMTMLLICQSMVFASSDEVRQESDIYVTPITENTYLLTSSNEPAAKMHVIETEQTIKIALDEYEAPDGYFLVDKEKGTLYSSYTGKTLTRSELASDERVDASLNATISSVTKSISYKKLSSVVTAAATQYTIACAIISVTAALMGVAIATVPGVVVSLIGVGFVVVIAGLNAKKDTEGIAVRIDKEERVKHQAGQTFKTYTYEIGKISFY